MARFSLRSFAGVASFMATGILSASVSTDSGPISQYFRDSSMDVASYLPTQTANIIASVLGGLGVVARGEGVGAAFSVTVPVGRQRDRVLDRGTALVIRGGGGGAGAGHGTASCNVETLAGHHDRTT